VEDKMKFKATFRTPGVNTPEQVKIIEASHRTDALLTLVDYIYETKGVAVQTTHTRMASIGFSNEEIKLMQEKGLDHSNSGVNITSLSEYKIIPEKGSKVL
jgi:hypothetical protein